MFRRCVSLLLSVSVFAVLLIPSTAFGATVATVEELSPEEQPFQYLNLRTNALYMAAKNWNGTLDVAIAPRWTVGLTYMHGTAMRRQTTSILSMAVSDDKYDQTMEQFMLGTNFYWAGNRQTDAFFVSPFFGVSFNKLNLVEIDKSFGGENTGWLAGVTANYQFMWPSGFNLQLGVGAMYVSPKEMTVANVANAAEKKTVEMPTAAFFTDFTPVLQVNAGIAL